MSKISIDRLAELTGLDHSIIRQMGKNAVLNQLLGKNGIHAAISCEDSRVSGYLGDAEQDVLGLEERKSFLNLRKD